MRLHSCRFWRQSATVKTNKKQVQPFNGGDHAEISEYLSDKNISNANDKAVGARITDILPKSLPIKNTITYMSAS